MLYFSILPLKHVWWSEWTHLALNVWQPDNMTVTWFRIYITGIQESTPLLWEWSWCGLPVGPHDVFKSATHLSLEKAAPSKPNRGRGCKQMAYEGCGSFQADWTGLVIYWGDPHCELSQEGHPRVIGFSYGGFQKPSLPLCWSDLTLQEHRWFFTMLSLFVNNLLAAGPRAVPCFGDKRPSEKEPLRMWFTDGFHLKIPF